MQTSQQLSGQSYVQIEGITRSLQKLGLKEKEARVYVALLKLGPSYPAAIAKETGMNRITCYDVLNGLLQKELILRIRKSSKLMYFVESTRAITEYLQRKQENLQNQLRQWTKLSPFLETLKSDSNERINVSFYEGRHAIETFLKDNWNFPGREVVGYSNLEKLFSFIDHSLIKKILSRRSKLQVSGKYLLSYGQEEVALKWKRMFYRGVPEPYQPKFRFVSDTTITFENHIKIYANRVALLDITGKNSGKGVIIEGGQISHTMRNIFKLAWRGARSGDE